jgi:hypothetical protein
MALIASIFDILHTFLNSELKKEQHYSSKPFHLQYKTKFVENLSNTERKNKNKILHKMVTK